MTEQIVRLPARCEDCDKAYRVPRADRTYACKVCGGTVRALEEPAPAHEQRFEGTVTCGECHAVNRDRARKCIECGADLDHALPPPTEEHISQLEEDAAEALQRAEKLIDAVAWIYRLGALAYLGVMIVAVLALARADVPRGQGLLMVLSTTLLAVLLVLGALRVAFEPVAWTLAIALLATGASLLHLFGPNPLGVALPANGALALILWIVFVPILRYRRLLEEHEDLYILHHASLQTMRSLRGHTGEDRHERLQRVRQRASGRAWKISIAAVVLLLLVSAVGTYVITEKIRPPELVPAMERFETAWREGGPQATADSFAAAVREQQVAWIEGVLGGHGLTEPLPPLVRGETRDDEKGLWVDYQVGELPLSVLWMITENEWAVASTEAPPPPLEPALEAFRNAWASSDAAAVAAFFPFESQDQMESSIAESARGRRWNSYPTIRNTQVGQPFEGETGVDFILEEGSLGTRWSLRSNGTWGLSFLKLPKR